MVEDTTLALDRTYAALSDPSRRAILARLRDGALRVTEIAAPFGTSLNAISKHLKALEQAGLVARLVRGREHWISLHADPLMEAAAWIEAYRCFWEERLDALESYLLEQGDERRQEGASP